MTLKAFGYGEVDATLYLVSKLEGIQSTSYQ